MFGVASVMSIGLIYLIRARSYLGYENRDPERDCIFVTNNAIRQRTGSSIKVYFPAPPPSSSRPAPPSPTGKRRRQVADADETSEGDDYRPIAGLAFFICFSKSDVGMPYLPTFYLATSVVL